jgi:metallo-beta-lactamase family protein
MPTLTFLGAAGTVTGSKHLLESDGHHVLVDSGLFQGLKELRERNWAAFPINPARIDAVILTHAHLDHCGYLPRLVAGGFRGRIFCTVGTRDLCTLILPDSARIQEEDARHANRRGYSKHKPALPLYTSLDAARALTQLQPVGYQRPVPVVPGLEVEFINAGHLLGSAFARVRTGNMTILFGGDLGRYNRPVLPDPERVEEADVLLLESTYGDRTHVSDNGGEQLASVINDTIRRGGRVIVPSFAVGRVEELLYWLKRLEDTQKIPVLPIYVDSPMAAGALQFYTEHVNELDPDMKTGTRDALAFGTRRLTIVASSQESAEVVASPTPAIVIASSGMATGGRVLHHLSAALPNSKNTVLFVGFQAEGTRGRSLCDGAKQVKMQGQFVPVGARVERIDWMSAHADAGEIMRWLSGFTRPPAVTYLVHGELVALDALRARLQAERGWPVHVAKYLERVQLG